MEEYVRWSPRGNKADRTLSLISSRGCPLPASLFDSGKGPALAPFAQGGFRRMKVAIERWGVITSNSKTTFTLQEARTVQILNYLADLRDRGKRCHAPFQREWSPG